MKQRSKKVAGDTSLTPSLEGGAGGGTPDETLDVSVPSVSGFYIDLEKQGKLQELPGLLKRRDRLYREVADATAKLQNINNRGWLVAFRRGRANFVSDLRKRAARLEEVRSKKSSQLAEIESQIAQIDPRALEIALPVGTTSPETISDIGLQENLDVARRDRLIQKLSNTEKSSLAICRALDFELGNQDAPPTGIPGRWVKQYGDGWKKRHGWKFYEAAYKDPSTKNAMQKMISVAKRK